MSKKLTQQMVHPSEDLQDGLSTTKLPLLTLFSFSLLSEKNILRIKKKIPAVRTEQWSYLPG